MGFFDELKKEISQAVNELVSDEELLQEEEIMQTESPKEEVVEEEQEYFDEDDYIETEEDYAQEKHDFGVVVDDYASDEYVNTLNIDISDLVKSYSEELTEDNDYSYAQAVQMLGEEGTQGMAAGKSVMQDSYTEYEAGEMAAPKENQEEQEDSDDVMVDTLGQIDFGMEEAEATQENQEEAPSEQIYEVQNEADSSAEYAYNEAYMVNQDDETEPDASNQMMSEMSFQNLPEESYSNDVYSEEVYSEEYSEEAPGEESAEEEIVEPVVEETSVIAQGMTVKGDIITEGSVDIFGTVEGNVKCKGKLNVGGYIYGYCEAEEIYANGAHISGNIVSKNGVWIGQDSVIVGNIFGESAVIAGAIKGDIDIHGPVVVDSTAIVMGDIKSKSVQIEIGAAIEGRCSQCYADVSPISFFKENQ